MVCVLAVACGVLAFACVVCVCMVLVIPDWFGGVWCYGVALLVMGGFRCVVRWMLIVGLVYRWWWLVCAVTCCYVDSDIWVEIPVGFSVGGGLGA
jgi:hypothetical protein